MSLTVTVQKGHDFSSGNVTRAALNAGAVPTISVTGSVGTTELAAGAVTATELANDAVTTAHILDANVTTPKIADNAVDLTKLSDYSVEKGALIKMGDTAVPGTVIPEVFSTKATGKMLIGTDTDLLSLGHDVDPVVDDTTTADQPSSHIGIAVNAASPPTGILLTLRDYAIKAVKLAKNKVAGVLTPGIIVYDNVGVASVLASTGTAGRVLTTNGTATPSFQSAASPHKQLVAYSQSTAAHTSNTGTQSIVSMTLPANHGFSHVMIEVDYRGSRNTSADDTGVLWSLTVGGVEVKTWSPSEYTTSVYLDGETETVNWINAGNQTVDTTVLFRKTGNSLAYAIETYGYRIWGISVPS
jgi:hypothetical protein